MRVRSITPGTARPTRVLCVDDSPDIADMIRTMLRREPTMQCVGCLPSADRLIATIRSLRPPPDVVLLDATMSGVCPFEAMRQMTARFPAIKTIVFSGYDDSAFIDRALSAGAWGCVSKNDEPSAILHAVRGVVEGEAWCPRPRRARWPSGAGSARSEYRRERCQIPLA